MSPQQRKDSEEYALMLARVQSHVTAADDALDNARVALAKSEAMKPLAEQIDKRQRDVRDIWRAIEKLRAEHKAAEDAS